MKFCQIVPCELNFKSYALIKLHSFQLAFFPWILREEGICLPLILNLGLKQLKILYIHCVSLPYLPRMYQKTAEQFNLHFQKHCMAAKNILQMDFLLFNSLHEY